MLMQVWNFAYDSIWFSDDLKISTNKRKNRFWRALA